MPSLHHLNDALLAKFFYQSGLRHVARGTSFERGLAVSLFQDAVEIASRAALTSCAIKPVDSFLGFWDQLSQKALAPPRDQLPMKSEMDRLNKARVHFKHHGNPPADARGYQADCHAFLISVFRDFLDKDFNTLSHADLIANDEMRSHIKLAEEALEADSVMACMERCRDAMDTARRVLRYIGEPGWVKEFSSPEASIDRATRSATQKLWSHLNHIRDVAYAGILGMNLAEVQILSDVLPLKEGDEYRFAEGVLGATDEAHARVIVRLVTEYCTRVSEHLNTSFDEL